MANRDMYTDNYRAPEVEPNRAPPPSTGVGGTGIAIAALIIGILALFWIFGAGPSDTTQPVPADGVSVTIEEEGGTAPVAPDANATAPAAAPTQDAAPTDDAAPVAPAPTEDAAPADETAPAAPAPSDN
ncbi:hypothetical protein [Pseudooceanicola lipolyticus]|nr:hypothetical protein [Pseudooceanicola lipolyticus]